MSCIKAFQEKRLSKKRCSCSIRHSTQRIGKHIQVATSLPVGALAVV